MVVANFTYPPRSGCTEKGVSVQEALIYSTNVCHGCSLLPPSAQDKAVAGLECSIGAQLKK
jgi:hypothetical protein